VHFFDLRNFQHFVAYFFPAFIVVFLFAGALAFTIIYKRGSEERKKRIIETHMGEIEERNAPFPLVASLIIIGTVLWLCLYILLTGLLGVKI
jgi:hypothetical protein